MTFTALLLRNLRYHWRGNLAVFLGVAVGTAVLTGALFVGDSLRGSLKELSLDQLGWVEQAMTPGRLFRAELAKAVDATPALILQAAAAVPARHTKKTSSKVTVVAIAGWGIGASTSVNKSLADHLELRPGDTIVLNVQKHEAVPRETLLGKRDESVQQVEVNVQEIMPDEGMARFTLRPSPEPVRNVFVRFPLLQDQLGLPGKANAILVGSSNSDLNAKLAAALTLEDWNLKLRSPADRGKSLVHFLDPRSKDSILRKNKWEGRIPDKLAKEADENGNLPLAKIIAFYEQERPYTILESGQMFLDGATERAATKVLQENGIQAVTPLIYLADAISDGQAEMPYAVVAAVRPAHLPVAKPANLKDDEIALVEWPGMPLQAKVGDSVTVTYYVPDERNQLQKKAEKFRVALMIPMQGAADDPDWTPEFPGITDKLGISEWENPPFPYNPKRVKSIDEEYWKRYRATPKAYVTLATGQRLWGTRFGKITSMRIPGAGQGFGERLLKELRPEAGGFVFQNVRERALRAATGSTDFGVLFLGFSFFLIAAALLLVGLLFRLNIDRRAAEMGLLLATGWSHRKVRGLLLAEGTVLAVVGALVGLVGALAYAAAMLEFLAASWPGGARLAFLRLHAEPLSFGIGYSASVLVSILTIVWATRVLGKMAPRALLAGETTVSLPSRTFPAHRRRWNNVLVLGSLLAGAGCFAAGFLVDNHEAKAGSFFGAGALLLTAALALAWRWLTSSGGPSDPQPSLTRLGVRNAGRHPVRSVLTVGLLASATFLIVAVEAFHKETGGDFLDKHGGSGGFALIAETDVPLFRDLHDPKLQLDWTPDQKQAVKGANFYPLRVRQGDDASCLNLYQPLKPRVLGVSAALRKEGRFQFAASLAADQEAKANPWLLLDQGGGDGAIPAIVDANSAEWILKVKLGETMEIADDNGDKVKLRIVALLQESIFQSEILISEENFLRLFPRREGFQYFLVATEPKEAGPVADTLRTVLADQGVQVQSTADKLRSFLAVENMYLDTFKALGGLGLLLGAAGLAIVLLRGVWERRGELALLRALGFRGGQLAWLVLAENAMLLALGLAAGTIAALLAVAPHLAGAGAALLWGRLELLLTVVVLVGLASGSAAVWGSLRAPLLTALRRE